MNKETAERVIQLMHNTPQIETVDLTGLSLYCSL
jgi:hypothetical protein